MKTSAFNASYTVHATIDTILGKGAQQLYNKYIMTKLPAHMKNDAQHITDANFNPVSMISQNQQSTIKKVHEPMINRICVANRSQNNKSSIGRDYPQTVKKTVMNQSLRIDSRKQKNKDTQTAVNSQQLRVSSYSRRSNSRTIDDRFKSITREPDSFLDEANEEEVKIFEDKAVRYDKQKAKEEEQHRQLYKANKLRRKLEEQFKNLQENNKPIVFDHETGRIIDLDDSLNVTAQNECQKPNIVSMRYGCNENEDICEGKSPVQSTVTSTRKITTFVRSQRKKISLDGQNIQDADYNNNGQRQSSIIGFLSPEEGVALTEGDATAQKRPASSGGRTSSFSANHRSFKSYTRQKMASSRYSRTITTVPSGMRTRLAFAQQSKTTNRTLFEKRHSSILWSGKSCKNHHISKNPSLVDNYFDFTEEAAQ